MIKLKRVYGDVEKSDGFRILVERLWPRGVSKEKAAIDLWLKEIAPSTELRQWFAHDPQKWKEFQTRYRHELTANLALAELRILLHTHKVITFVYAAPELQNSAMVLEAFLKKS
jgi:uncharacterized protein YeaO (DUF488 family)